MDMGTTAVVIGGPAVAGYTNRHKYNCVHFIAMLTYYLSDLLILVVEMSVSVEVYLVPPLGVAVCSAVGRRDIMSLIGSVES